MLANSQQINSLTLCCLDPSFRLSGTSFDRALVKPLATLLASTRHPALLYALLLVRTHFLKKAEDDLAFEGLIRTRAALCELPATKLLSLFDARSTLPLVLTTRFNAYVGVQKSFFEDGCQPTQAELDELVDEGADMASSALDIAVDSRAKSFIRSPAVQYFLNDLYFGHLLYKPSSQHSMIKDSYKSGTVEFFDISSRPLLDHNVLRVPRIRRLVEFATILVLVALFLVVQQLPDVGQIRVPEILLILFTCGFALEEFGSIRERGFQAYLQHLWNIFDLAYLGIVTSKLTCLYEADNPVAHSCLLRLSAPSRD